MDIFDKLAFVGRRYEKQRAPSTGSARLNLHDVLQMFDRSAILELTPSTKDTPGKTIRPDAVRKMKVSLLDDGISAIHSDSGDWYEAFRTAPSGDLSRVRIVAYSPSGARVGEIRMLVGRRSFDHYFAEDPILDALAERQA
jgi:hypothetical protein